MSDENHKHVPLRTSGIYVRDHGVSILFCEFTVISRQNLSWYAVIVMLNHWRSPAVLITVGNTARVVSDPFHAQPQTRSSRMGPQVVVALHHMRQYENTAAPGAKAS